MNYRQQNEKRVRTGIEELDEVLAGGFTPGSTTLILGCSGRGKTVLATQLSVGMALKLPESQKGWVIYNDSDKQEMQHRMVSCNLDIPYEDTSSLKKAEVKIGEFLGRLESKLDYELRRKIFFTCPDNQQPPPGCGFLIYDYLGGEANSDLEKRKWRINQVRAAGEYAKKHNIPVIIFIQANQTTTSNCLHLTADHVSECRTLDEYVDTVIGISNLENVYESDEKSRQQCLYVSKNAFGKEDQEIWVECEFEFQRFGFRPLRGQKITIATPQKLAGGLGGFRYA